MKRAWGIIIGLMLSWLSATGQSFFAPEVSLNLQGMPEQKQADLQGLQRQLEYMLIGYDPEIEVTLRPKQPIRIQLSLSVTQSVGDEYSGHLDIALFRPVYGADEEALLVLFHEKNLLFPFDPLLSPTFIGGEIPESPLFKVMYYYATLGAMYYYDSFSLYGGDPFLNYLVSRSGFFEAGWQDSGGLSNAYLTSKLSPSKYLPELQSKWGSYFRELWYLYHREGLDSPLPTAYNRVLTAVLQGLRQLREYESSTSFLTLFFDSKEKDMSAHFQANKGSLEVGNTRSLVEELFPSVVFSR